MARWAVLNLVNLVTMALENTFRGWCLWNGVKGAHCGLSEFCEIHCSLSLLPPPLVSSLFSSPLRCALWSGLAAVSNNWHCGRFLYVLLMLMSTREFQDFRCVARIRNL